MIRLPEIAMGQKKISELFHFIHFLCCSLHICPVNLKSLFHPKIIYEVNRLFLLAIFVPFDSGENFETVQYIRNVFGLNKIVAQCSDLCVKFAICLTCFTANFH